MAASRVFFYPHSKATASQWCVLPFGLKKVVGPSMTIRSLPQPSILRFILTSFKKIFTLLRLAPNQYIKVAAIPETQLSAIVNTMQYGFLYSAAVKPSIANRYFSLHSAPASPVPRCESLHTRSASERSCRWVKGWDVCGFV